MKVPGDWEWILEKFYLRNVCDTDTTSVLQDYQVSFPIVQIPNQRGEKTFRQNIHQFVCILLYTYVHSFIDRRCSYQLLLISFVNILNIKMKEKYWKTYIRKFKFFSTMDLILIPNGCSQSCFVIWENGFQVFFLLSITFLISSSVFRGVTKKFSLHRYFL